MGEVYEAEDAELRERIALKTIHPGVASEAGAVERFKREIHLARKVTHPNVCRIFDLGAHLPAAGAEPILFLTMELLEGETLAARAQARRPPRHRPGPADRPPVRGGARGGPRRRASSTATSRARTSSWCRAATASARWSPISASLAAAPTTVSR